MFRIVRSSTIREYKRRILELEEMNRKLKNEAKSREKQKNAGVVVGGYCFSCIHSVPVAPFGTSSCKHLVPCEKFEKKPENFLAIEPGVRR